MPMLSMATMAMDTIWDMPTMDTMDTHMPTVDTSMARDLLMLSQRPRMMLMLCMDTTDMPTTHMPMDIPPRILRIPICPPPIRLWTPLRIRSPWLLRIPIRICLLGLRCVQELKISFCEVGFIPSHKDNRLQNFKI